MLSQKKLITQIFFIFFISTLFAEKMTAPDGVYPDFWESLDEHKGYAPYITEFGYRSIADHVIDATHRDFDPANVKLGDSLYVGIWYLNWFISEVHDKIPNPYVLITSDVGAHLPHLDHLKLIYDPKVVCWFSKNMLFTNHRKLSQLPMGQFYHQWMISVGQALPKLNDLITHLPKEKDILLYLNYAERDHGRRIEIADAFWDKPFCFNRNRPRQPTSFDEFWNEAARSKFVLSPLGLEVDCTRTWECFLLGAIPIVEHSFLDPLFDKLPILLVHDWDNINEVYLNDKYQEIFNKPKKIERAYIDYWVNLIKKKQRMVRRGDLEMGSLEANNFSDQDIKIMSKILSKNKKIETSLIYIGNMTCLRPFQLARELRTLPEFFLNDQWTEHGLSFLKAFAKNSALIESSRVKIISATDADQLIEKKDKTVFLDLTHFRHKLFKDCSELENFKHSLENDILSIYLHLSKGNLLLGNMISDTYVKDVLDNLQNKYGMKIKIKENFWFVKKINQRLLSH